MYELETRLIDLTVADLIDIIKSVQQDIPVPVKDYKEKKYVYGLSGLAELFGCCKSTAAAYKKSGKFDAAISQEGRKIVIDADLALELRKLKNESNDRKYSAKKNHTKG